MDNIEQKQPEQDKQSDKEPSVSNKMLQIFFGFFFVITTIVGIFYLFISGAGIPGSDTQPIYYYLIPVWILFMLGVAKLSSYLIKKVKFK